MERQPRGKLNYVFREHVERLSFWRVRRIILKTNQAHLHRSSFRDCRTEDIKARKTSDVTWKDLHPWTYVADVAARIL